MGKTSQVVITFYTSAEAMAAERLCKAMGLPGRLISAPRSLSADCGIAWTAPQNAAALLRQALEENGIAYDQFCALVR